MNKPITLLKRDCEQKIADVINNSGLPAFVIGYILSDMQIQVRQLEGQQLKQDEEVWNKYQNRGEDNVYSDGNPTE